MNTRRRRWYRVCLVMLVAGCISASPAPAAEDVQWSTTVNGLRGRVAVKVREVNNGTPILEATLFLQNKSNVMNTMRLPWKDVALKARVVDAAGKPQELYHGPYDGFSVPRVDLLLPTAAELSFPITSSGAGIPADKGGLLELSVDQCWALPRDGAYTLELSLEAPGKQEAGKDGTMTWSGKLELPPVLLPGARPAATKLDAKQIEELGKRLLSGNGNDSDAAKRELSQIDDPKVIPIYVRAVQSRLYDLKFAGLDRLARFKEDAALEGLKIGMATRGKDIDNATTPELAEQLADNIRHEAAVALARSPNAQAKKLLITMANDPYYGVRLTVLHTMNEMNTTESVAVIQSLTKDADERVRQEAKRYMDMRAAGK